MSQSRANSEVSVRTNNAKAALKDQMRSPKPAEMMKAMMNVLLTYATVLFAGNALCRYLGGSGVGSNGPMDMLSYLSSLVEAVGLLALMIRIQVQRSVAGLSGKTMIQYGVAYFLRMLCIQASFSFAALREWSFEFLDVLAWLMALRVVWAIFRGSKELCATYNAEDDVFPVKKLIPACLALGFIFRLDVHLGDVKSVLWTACLFLETTALLPQVFMIAKMGVPVEALTSHFVAATGLSRMLDVGYWYYAFPLVAPSDGGFNLVGYVIVFCHLMHALLLCDFMYYYLKFRFVKGFTEAMELPCEEV